PLICRAPALPAPVPHAPSRVSIVLPLPCLCALCSGRSSSYSQSAAKLSPAHCSLD
ncbi:hypothetical protein S245_056303, partial [Arachis hypogaea]